MGINHLLLAGLAMPAKLFYAMTDFKKALITNKGSAMLKFILLALLLLSACSTTPQDNAITIVENVNIIPMDKAEIIPHQALVIRDGTIVRIINQDNARKIPARTRINGAGRYLMPGLADMHVHVRWNPQVMFNLFLANGVTTVANMRLADGEGQFDHLQLRDQIASGEILGPRYLVSGAHLEKDLPASAADVDKILDDHLQRKIDFVKIHGDLKPEIYDAIIKGAKQRGIKVIGHAQHKMPLQKTLELDTLEHMEEFLYVAREPEVVADLSKDLLPAYHANVNRMFEPAYRKNIVDEVAASGIHLDPTLIVYKMVGLWASDEDLAAMRNDPELKYLPEGVREHWLNPATNPYQEEGFPITKAEVDRNLSLMFLLTKEFHDQGVPLLSGTDTFGTLVPGISLHQELKLLVEAGLSPYEALKCSTINVASYLGEAGSAGVIKAGARADFILLDKNPLLDIGNSRSVSGVYTHGRRLDRNTLAALRSSARQP